MSENKHSNSPFHLPAQPAVKVRKSDRTRTAILNAALDFLWTQPFRDMTVATLTTSAGVSRPAFYRYFKDLAEVMEILLDILRGEILDAAEGWIAGTGDPVTLLNESIAGLVHVCYDRGPFLLAITDAATTDKRLEKTWKQFLAFFDNATQARIEADQKQNLIPQFDARPVAFAITRLDAYTLLQAFGNRPRSRPGPVRDALTRIWISTLYGNEWIGKESSNLVRK